MILSVSRRTDIPAVYSDWFFNRLRDGVVLVRNPMNTHQVSRIHLSPEGIDCIVFWSKNPQPMLARLDELKEYSYYFQFTINAYGEDIEKHVPPLDARINTFKELSDKIGPERVIWRYDPILLTNQYSEEFHLDRFAYIADNLKSYTKQCVISFVDTYKKLQRSFAAEHITEMNEREILKISSAMAQIGSTNGICLKTCSEKIDLSYMGIEHAHCIDENLITQLIGKSLKTAKDRNQRKECGCVSSVDIGQYSTCTNGCSYCYANYNETSTQRNHLAHRDDSPLLVGTLLEGDRITERVMK